MKKRNWIFKILCAGVCAIIFMTGCEKSPGEEPEITVEYLSGEYAAQLVKDGAEVIFGSLEIEEKDGGIFLNVYEKEFTENARYPKGFYIADKNMTTVYQLADEARTTFLSGGTSIAKVMTIDEFVSSVKKDFDESALGDADNEKLYDIYIIGDQAELIIARYIP